MAVGGANPPEEILLIQKATIRKCALSGEFVIIGRYGCYYYGQPYFNASNNELAKGILIQFGVKIVSDHIFKWGHPSYIKSTSSQVNHKVKGFFMEIIKHIALVAHDNRKKDLVEWVEFNFQKLVRHNIISTGTTGRFVEEAMKKKLKGKEARNFEIMKLKSGPLGGDQQLGAMIAENKVDLIIFLCDPMQPQPHDVDVKALLRISVLYNIPTACNRSTADFMISSPLLDSKYEPKLKDYSRYVGRTVKL